MRYIDSLIDPHAIVQFNCDGEGMKLGDGPFWHLEEEGELSPKARFGREHQVFCDTLNKRVNQVGLGEGVS